MSSSGSSRGVSSPINLVTTAANPVLANKLLAGDANAAFQIGGDGKLQWGAGGASVLDVSLARVSAGQLRTTRSTAGNTVFLIASGGGGNDTTAVVCEAGAGVSVAHFGYQYEQANGAVDIGSSGAHDVSFNRNDVRILKLVAGAAFQNMIAANEAVAATAGANGAPPAQVAGYLVCQDHTGTTIKIPYYAN